MYVKMCRIIIIIIVSRYVCKYCNHHVITICNILVLYNRLSSKIFLDYFVVSLYRTCVGHTYYMVIWVEKGK